MSDSIENILIGLVRESNDHKLQTISYYTHLLKRLQKSKKRINVFVKRWIRLSKQIHVFVKK